jgi:hypothetical protein
MVYSIGRHAQTKCGGGLSRSSSSGSVAAASVAAVTVATAAVAVAVAVTVESRKSSNSIGSSSGDAINGGPQRGNRSDHLQDKKHRMESMNVQKEQHETAGMRVTW